MIERESRNEAATTDATRVDPAAWERRRERLSAILSAMADHAMVQSTFRCPYKNRHDECTAKFGCRNQRRPRPGGSLLMCGGDDKLDYRGAWESGAEAPPDQQA
jgi:hypothetical protein